MIRTIARQRNNSNVAAGYVARALKRGLIRSFHNLSSSPCLPCRKTSYKTFLQQRRRLRRMSTLRHMRSKSAPVSSSAGPIHTAAPALIDSPSVPTPLNAPAKPTVNAPAKPTLNAPEKPLVGSPESSKKRKASASEPPEPRPQVDAKKRRKSEEPQAKKQRKSEESQPKKSEPKSPKQPESKSSKSPKQPSDDVPPITKQAKKQDATPKGAQSPKFSMATGHRISKTWPASVGKQKVKGLSNPGNWCYRRSVLQSLIAVPQFFNLLDDSHKSCSKQGKCVTCALRQLLRTYQATPGGVGKDLGALDNAIRVTGKTSDPRWRAGGQTQEDSHEFLQYLLGTVENAKGVSKDQFASLFGIKHRIAWTCNNCKKVHVRSDPPGLSLNLPIPKQNNEVSLDNCLDTYHREPNVTIRCDKCKKNEKRTRVFQLEDAPDVLPIQLMRFGFGNYGSTKNKQHVEFPEELDLTRWALDKSKKLQYKLQAVVAHSGTLKFGHYIAYVRGPDGIKDISDSDVSGSNAKEWRKPSSGFHPYILMYIKQ